MGNGDPVASKSAETKRYGEKRQAIVHAASVLINEAGVKATTLSEVARAIGLNATSITYYFSRKEQLVVAVYEETLDLMEQMAREALREPDPESRLRKYISLHVSLRRRIRKGAQGLVTALSEIRTLDPEWQDHLLLRYRAIVETIRAFFGPANSDAERAAQSAKAHILLETMMWWPVWSLRYSILDFPRVEDRLFDVLAHGIPSQKGAWEPVPFAERPWRTDEDHPPSQNEEFLRAATVMINQRGYRGASVNRIAESLNVTKGSFYHHLDAKDDLVLECFRRSHRRISNVQRQAAEAGSTEWEHMETAMAALLDIQFAGNWPLTRTSALQALPPYCGTVYRGIGSRVPPGGPHGGAVTVGVLLQQRHRAQHAQNRI